MNTRLCKTIPTQILRRCGQFNRIPVNLFDICRVLDLHIKETDFSEIEAIKGKPIIGAIYVYEGRTSLCCSNDIYADVSNRLSNAEFRYVIARQIAMYHLDFNPETDSFYLDYGKDDLDLFCCELLIPAPSLISTYNRLVVPSVEFLANLFEVPIELMCKRLTQLSLTY